MPRYRLGSNVVDAIQFTGSNPDEIMRLAADYSSFAGDDVVSISVPEGQIVLEVGDWLTRDAWGDLFPCPDDAFLRGAKPVTGERDD
jgi:hypothetical protein